MRSVASALVAVTLLLFGTVSLAGPGAPETLRSSLPDPRITIGCPYTKTGRWSSYGAEWRTVFEIYQKNVNSQGGVLVNGTRYAVDFILVDVGADALSDMVSNTQQAISGSLSTVDFIIGPYSSTLTDAALKSADSSKLFLAPGASADTLFVCDGSSDTCPANTRRHKNLFSTALRAGLLFEGIINLAAVHGAKSFAYFYEDTLFTQAACNGVKNQVQERNLKLVTADMINAVGQGNLTADTAAQLTKIISSYKKSNPDFVVGCTYQYSCEHVINLLRTLDYVPLGLALSTCVGREDLLEAVGLDSRYIIGPALWHPRLTGSAYVEDSSHPVGFFSRTGVSAPQEFYRQFEYQAGTDPTYTAASVMASLYALHTAFVRSGSVQPAAVAARMNVLMLSSSFYGPIAFDTFGRLNFPPLTVQYDINNEARVLTPLPAADGDLTYPFPTFAQRNCLEAKTCGVNGQCQRDGECLCAPGWTGSGCATADIKIKTILEKDRCKGLYGAVVALLILWIFFAGLTLVGCICWKRDKSRFARYSATPDSESVTQEATTEQ